ncbi:MAG: hypothetical protein K1000chlam2_00683 [Chlamydiae bacterium]|nr:hypothetical protein [Chlamydiota bacterium]
MYFLIDGYNFLFRLHGEQGQSLEKRRVSLIETLNQELSAFKGNISVIFDSSEQIRDFAQSAKLKNLEVIYAPKGQTADAYIIELAEQNRSPKMLTVVTSDGGLARQCQHIGTQTVSIEEFITFVMKKRKKIPKDKPAYKESTAEMERLMKIFEERLKGD